MFNKNLSLQISQRHCCEKKNTFFLIGVNGIFYMREKEKHTLHLALKNSLARVCVCV